MSVAGCYSIPVVDNTASSWWNTIDLLTMPSIVSVTCIITIETSLTTRFTPRFLAIAGQVAHVVHTATKPSLVGVAGLSVSLR